MNTKVNIPIYFVSLKQDIARREKLKKCFPETYSSFQYIEAVDGRILSAKEYFDKTQGFFKKYKHTMLPAELGCTLSHIKALEQFLASGKEFGVILEDDVIGTDEDIYLIEHILNILPKKNDFLFFLGMHKTPYMRYQVGFKTKQNNNRVHRFSYRYLYGTFAYSITRGMAEEILYMHEKCMIRADDWGELLSKKTQASVYFKNILRHPELMIDSHIELERKSKKIPLVYRLFTASGLISILKRIFAELLMYVLIFMGNRRLK